MTERVTNDRAEGDLMLLVKEGMEVFDKSEKKVGKVESLFMGARADSQGAGGEPAYGTGPETTEDDALITSVARAFDDSMPAVLRNRMRTNGFIRIRGGLLKGDRYALREHVAAVAGDRVILNVRAEELIGA